MSSPSRPDDASTHALRRAIGVVGMALPILVVLVAGLRPTAGLERWRMLDSISAYAHTAGGDVLVGMLAVLAMFLFTYRGYRNRYGWADRLCAIVAGVAAIGVAYYPNPAPPGVAPPDWWIPTTGIVHAVATIVLFSVFAVFSLWLFRLHGDEPPTPDKRRRNVAYLVCGILIIVGMAWAGVASLMGRSIFYPEVLVLWAFGVSWLIKGRAIEAMIATLRPIAEHLRALAQ